MKGNQCYPNISVTNDYPGFVKTEVLRNSSPWYLSGILAVGMIGSLPVSYAEVPFYLLANPGTQSFRQGEILGSGRLPTETASECPGRD